MQYLNVRKSMALALSLLLVVTMLSLSLQSVFAQVDPVVTIPNDTATHNVDSATETILAPNLTLTGPATITEATISISTGLLTAEDQLTINSATSGTITGITYNYDAATGNMTLSGEQAIADYQAALRLVAYSNTVGTPTLGNRQIDFTVSDGAIYYPFNGHFYKIVNNGSNITWTDALSNAQSSTLAGLQGYLVTITFEAENDFVTDKLSNVQGWMGSSDDPTYSTGGDKVWQWINGPEQGTTFTFQNGYVQGGPNTCGEGVQSDNGQYQVWDTGEPNDFSDGCATGEDYGHFLPTGDWNDYANDNSIQYYVIEYGGMPGDPVDLSIIDSLTLQVIDSNNTPPIGNNDSYSTPVDTTLNIAAPGVLANDSDADMDSLTAVAISNGTTNQGGTVTLATDGSFAYTPANGFTGSDGFVYTVTDGTATDTGFVVITVTNVANTAPVGVDDAYNATQDTQLSVNAPGVLSNDTDADMDSLTAVAIVAGTTTQNGTVNLNTDGSFTYDPAASFTGTDTFTYTVTDGTASDTATVTITVSLPGDIPIRIYPANTQTLTSANASDWSQFTFQHEPGLEWYAVWIGLNDYSYEAHYEWHEAATICDMGSNICTVPVDIWLPDGEYEWWMTYWSPSFPDYNSYWNVTTFTVGFATPSSTVGYTAPTGTITSQPTTIVWQRDVEALWYHLWVGEFDTANTFTTFAIFDWFDATEICDTTTCTLDVSGYNFPNATYEVWMEVWGPDGLIDWFGVSPNPVGEFTVSQ